MISPSMSTNAVIMRTVNFPFTLVSVFGRNTHSASFENLSRWNANCGGIACHASPEGMMNTTRRQFVVAAMLMASSCMYSRGPQQTQESAVVEVDNQGVLDMTVYVMRGAERVRLGIAGGLKKTALPLPANIVFGPTTLRFVADPIGSNRNSVSDEITVSPGDTVTWTIRP